MTRGDVYELRPGRAARGHEQRGKRFGVVLQASALLSLSTVVVAPTSRTATGSYLHPTISVRGRATQLLVPQLKAVDHSRLGKRVGHLSVEEAAAVDDALHELLGLFY